MNTFDMDLIGGRRGLAELVDVVVQAGQHALALFKQGAASTMQLKADQSPVTEADKAVERHLRAWIESRLPQAGILGEEEEERVGTAEGVRFVIDPIDGTRAFIRGLDSWSVLVGVEYRATPCVGVAYLPAKDEIFVGVLGHGATGNGRTLRVSETARLDRSLIMHGGANQFAQSFRGALLDAVAESTFTQRCLGDFLNFRALLLGQADGLIEAEVKPWDLCAPAVLVREAGGILTSSRGEHSIYGGDVVAGNAAIHPQLLALWPKPR